MDLKRSRLAIAFYFVALEKLLQQRERLSVKIGRIADLIAANANLLPDEERLGHLRRLNELVAGPPGFTDSIRRVLKDHRARAVTAIAVRDLLGEAGFDLGSYNNPLASIHTILKRLAERGEVETSGASGEVRYRWKQS